MAGVRKPTQRRLDSAKETLIQVAQWARLDGSDRDDISRVVHILNQIEDGEIGAHEEGTL